MLLGIGNDLCDIRRIERSLERFGERFTQRVFSAEERARATRKAAAKHGIAASYAKRFAAKEACAKALGTGFSRGVFMADIGVVNLPSGRPTLQLTGGAAAALARLVPAGMQARIDLTLTDEYPLAQAIVVISAVSGEVG